MKRALFLLLAALLIFVIAMPALAEYKIYMTEESTAEIKHYSKLQKGSKGSAVRDLQERLAFLGYMRYDEVDGSYGNRTKDAVYTFQIDNFLTGADGVAYPYTLYKLHDATAIPAEGIPHDTLSEGDSGLEVLRLEKRLCDTGFMDDYFVDGYYDANTVECMFIFQSYNGFDTDGIAWPEVLYKLYSYDMNSRPPYGNG